MSDTNFPFPYDIDNLLGGAVRILMAEMATAVPTNIADVVDMESTYAPKTGWTDIGATKESFTYERGFDESGFEIQQTPGAVLSAITDITRTIQISFAELNPENLQLIEGAPNIATIAAAAGKSAQKKVAFGGFSSVGRKRFAFISQRAIDSGVVTESDTTTKRGRFFMGVAYAATLAADSVSFEQNKGDLSAIGVTFTLFPQAGQPTGEDWGAWFDEQAGAIA